MQVKRRLQEEILLIKIQHGDREAFAKLYELYVDSLYRFVSFRVNSVELAQDLTSELFFKVWQRLVSDKERVGNVRAFLYQAARNLIADHYRSVQEELPLTEADDVAVDTTVQDLDVQLSLEQIKQGLTKLKPEWQEVLLLAFVEQLRPREIAVIIEKSPSATRVIIHRALQELKRSLNNT